MFPRILLLHLLIGISFVLQGQSNIQDMPDKLVSLFQKQLEVFPQEKIYVHTDKPYYISGEKIWFRAYIADAKSHEPVSVSRYVYVELINPLNAVVKRVKIRQEEGAYYGYMPIPEDAPDGDYTLRAYTAFMQNQDENYFFTKTFYIGDPKARPANPDPKVNEDFDVTFYPEGGSLMQGTFCKVAFKAMNTDGSSAEITGKVYEQKGKEFKEVKEFKTEHLGMGGFPLLAEKGKTYYAICQTGKGQSKRFDLPAAVDHGYALSVNWTKDKIYVTVLKPAEAAQNDSLYLLAHTRGIVHFADRWDNEKNYIVLQPDQFPSGVLQLVLFDSGQHRVSERLIFINNNDQAQVRYQPDQENYTTRSLVKNRISLIDSNGQPLSGSFSVAVTSDREVTPDSTSNILTQLLLTSDLRGNIENPAYYFQHTNVSALALDLLMCTQGWRRYNMEEVAKGNFAKPKVSIETIPEISGIVKNDLLGTSAKNIEITIMSLKNDFFDKTKTDKDGRFSFRGIEWTDSTSFVVQANMKKTATAKNLIIDRENFPKRTFRALPQSMIDSVQFAKYSDKADRQYVMVNGMRMIHLPEVQISTERKTLKKSNYYDAIQVTNSIKKEELKLVANNARSLFDILRRFPSVRITAGIVEIRGGSPIAEVQPLLLLDDVIYKGSLVELSEEVPVSQIAQVDVLAGANSFGMKGMGGVIAVYTKNADDYKDDIILNNIKDISPLGYQPPVEFYAPKYDTPEKRNMQTLDLRTTIHWQPVVQADSSGVASFEFYSADEPTSYTVILEGLANDGSIIHREEKLWIRSTIKKQ